MLVLGRKEDQSIEIGDGIRVTILRIKGNCVRVGVEAPDKVRILRGELTSIAQEWEAEIDCCAQQSGVGLARCE